MSEELIFSKELFKGGVKPGDYKGVTPKNDVVKRGKETICWCDYINENNVDVEIYTTLKKYGSLKEEQFDYVATAGEFDELTDLHEQLAKTTKAKEMFDNLPLEIREHFNNDINNFVDNGAAYCEELIKKDKKAAEDLKKAQQQEKQQAEEQAAINHTNFINNLKAELGL